MNKISVINLEKRFKKFEKSIRIIAERALKILRKENIGVEVYLAGSREMRFLNKKFRGKDKAADVLSFEEPRGFVYPQSKFKKIGEIYLNMTKDSRKLLIHGFLHLLGYNHKKKNDRIRMEKAEQKLLLKIRSAKHEIRNNI